MSCLQTGPPARQLGPRAVYSTKPKASYFSLLTRKQSLIPSPNTTFSELPLSAADSAVPFRIPPSHQVHQPERGRDSGFSTRVSCDNISNATVTAGLLRGTGMVPGLQLKLRSAAWLLPETEARPGALRQPGQAWALWERSLRARCPRGRCLTARHKDRKVGF